MDPDDARRQRLLAAGTSSPPPGDRWTPPTPEELSGTFPQLQILELIGQGGMGAVYKARQTHLDRLVAVKVLAPHLTTQADFAQRFQREAMVLAKLTHPHIVSLYDVGEAGPWRYLVMEYIEGATLREVLTTGPFTTAAALTLAPQLCDALAYAHAQGIIHRDLKPENILIDAAGKGHIADFGLATLADRTAGMSITKTGDVLGTAAYMAPEQLSGASGIDHRADLYALGVIIYEMLTGHLPLGRFEVPSYQGRLDVRIDSVVLQALERTPELRWQSADEMRRAVDALKPGAAPAPTLDSPLRRVVALCAATLVLGILLGVVIPPLLRSNSSGITSGPVSTPLVTHETTPPLLPLPPAAPAMVSPVTPAPPLTSVATPQALSPSSPAAVEVKPQTVAPPELPTVDHHGDAAPSSSLSSTVAPTPVAPTVLVNPAPTPLPPTVLPAAPSTPAPEVAVPVPPVPVVPTHTLSTTPLTRRLLVVTGPGEVTIDCDPQVTDLHDLHDDAASGLTVSSGNGSDVMLTLTLSQAHAHVRIPAQLLQTLRYTGSGRILVRGLSGDHLDVEHDGGGTLELDRLAVKECELFDRSTFLTRISGTVTTIIVHLAPLRVANASTIYLPPPAAATSIGYCDAIHLTFSHLQATIDGGACLRMQGHAQSVQAVLSDGFIDATALSVDKADVTVTGSGTALFGDLGALDASCTGSGTLHWTGNPVLGHVITNK